MHVDARVVSRIRPRAEALGAAYPPAARGRQGSGRRPYRRTLGDPGGRLDPARTRGAPAAGARESARRAARACEAALAAAGVRGLVVGSLAYGGVHAASDLDLLIVSYPGKKWSEVSTIAADAARPYGVPVDVIFADTLPPAVRSAMIKDARRASQL